MKKARAPEGVARAAAQSAWQRVDLVIDRGHALALCEALEAEGALSTELCDAEARRREKSAVFAESGELARLWPRCRLSALFAPDADVRGALSAARLACGLVAAPRPASVERLEDADWMALTQRQFQPIRVSASGCGSCPAGISLPRRAPSTWCSTPGAAFGTGSHPTTRLCLAWLERHVRPGDTVLDYGCGSGILAIAAPKLGARSALGVDIDPNALESARYNAKRNGVRLQIAPAQGAVAGAARLTVANILANPLRLLAPVLAAHTAPGGALALSGIMEEQSEEVIGAYRSWVGLKVEARAAGWVLLAGRSRAKA